VSRFGGEGQNPYFVAVIGIALVLSPLLLSRLVAGAGHWLLGSPDFGMLGSLLIGSLPGIVISSSVAPRTSENLLRYLLAAVLVLVAWKLLG
ncbi:MAG: hypothetical protein WAW96_00325, partial [Alphaproteobacteria bacterium]